MASRTLLIGLCASALISFAASDTRLPDAAMRGDREAVRSLLKQKVDVNATQGDGSTALHWAAYKDDPEMVKMLLAAGANVNAETRDGAITPIFMACSSGDAAIIDALLAKGASAKSVKSNGTTALMMAAESGSTAAVKTLLDHGADVNAKESVHGQTALMFAAARNRDAVVRLLMAQGADANIATSVHKLDHVRYDQDGNIVEERPKGTGDTPDAKALNTFAEALGFESGVYLVDMAAADEEALNLFSRSVGLKTVDYLVDTKHKKAGRAGDVANRPPRKIGPDYQGGMTALLYAAREGYMTAAQALVEGGANVNEVSGGEKMSPMVEAIINGHLDLANYLLNHGADPNLATEAGLTALYATVDVQWAPKAWFPQPSTDQEKTSYLDLMKALLVKGANVNRKSARSCGSGLSPTITPGWTRPVQPLSGERRNRAICRR